MRIWLLFFFSLLFTFGNTQNIVKREVKLIVDSFIDAINKRDTDKIQELLDSNVGLLTIFYDGSKTILTAESVEMFISNIEDSQPNSWYEELVNYKISCSDVLATVWSDYNFYMNNKIHHCGENAFQLYKSPKGWKIIQITDSRYKLDACQQKNPYNKYENKASLIKFIDNWHKNASQMNLELYFDAIAENGVYIGTDPEEFWTKSEFKNWVNKTIKLKSGFYFQTIDRNIFFNDEEDMAWFNEKLNTSIGICHATGVVTQMRNGWKINYYQLSVTVPNELLKPFIELKKTLEKSPEE